MATRRHCGVSSPRQLYEDWTRQTCRGPPSASSCHHRQHQKRNNRSTSNHKCYDYTSLDFMTANANHSIQAVCIFEAWATRHPPASLVGWPFDGSTDRRGVQQIVSVTTKRVHSTWHRNHRGTQIMSGYISSLDSMRSEEVLVRVELLSGPVSLQQVMSRCEEFE